MPSPRRIRPRLVTSGAALSRAARTAGGEVFTLSRLTLAAKTALAAAIAWYLAPLIPFASAEYSYYAPLGVLVSMYPTIADSARAGLQAIGGLAIGIAIGLVGLVIVWGPSPGIVGVAFVVGVGVAVGGIRSIGAGRDWIAIAALFVLLLGAADVDGFSTSYLVTMAFGVVVGLAVNFLILPPLYLRRASTRLNQLRDVVAARLDILASETEELARPDTEGTLMQTLDAVAADVQEAARSRQAHPLARRRRAGEVENRRRLAALDDIVRQTLELSRALETVPQDDAYVDARASLVEAIRRVADAVAMPVGDVKASETVDAAKRTLSTFIGVAPLVADGRMSSWAAAGVALGRIAESSRPID